MDRLIGFDTGQSQSLWQIPGQIALESSVLNSRVRATAESPRNAKNYLTLSKSWRTPRLLRTLVLAKAIRSGSSSLFSACDFVSDYVLRR